MGRFLIKTLIFGILFS